MSAVVKLPTAAPRMVRQPQNKGGRAARAALREAQGCEFPFMRPEEREVAHLVDYMEANPLTAERRVLFALIKALDPDAETRLKLAVGCAGDASALNLVELIFADQCKTFAIQSVLRRRGLA